MHRHTCHIALFVLLCCFAWNMRLSAQTHDVSLGVHLGGSMYLTDGPHRNLPSGATGIDVAYTIRGNLTNQTALGVKLGAGLTLANATHSLDNYQEKYTNIDYYPSTMDYTITSATYTERQMQLQLETPLYLSFITHGITINVGGKFMMPFFQQRRLDVTDAHITAYYEEFWVSVTDYKATGCLPNHEYHSKESVQAMPRLNALLSAEIGYEWTVGKKNRIGVLLYLDYSVWNNYQNTPRGYRLIDVDPVRNTEYPVPNILVNALSDIYSTKANYLGCGVKFYYAFHGKSVKCNHCMLLND